MMINSSETSRGCENHLFGGTADWLSEAIARSGLRSTAEAQQDAAALLRLTQHQNALRRYLDHSA